MEEAVDWFVRRDAGALSETERTAFEAWLAADPAHGTAYAEVARVWSDLDCLPATRRPGSRTLEKPGTDAKPALSSDRRAVRRWHRATAGAVAAGILLLVVIGTDMPTRLQADALSNVGETKTVALPDGSTAVLNTFSAIAIDYTPDERRIRLLRGEAEFTVAKDAARPFRVEAHGGLSTALGTVFLARRRDDGATITVLESRVAVAVRGNTGRARKVVLSPDKQVTYVTHRGLGPVEPVDARVTSAWRRGKLIFVNQRLGDVIEELNRYHAGEIRILDRSVRDRKVNGVFETRDPVAAVNALEASLGLSSTRFSDLLILLH